MNCPNCQSLNIVKNGLIHNGKQNYRCKDCGRQFVENPQQKLISQQTKDLVDKLLLEKIPLAGIARVCDVSEVWLQGYVNRKYAAVPRQVDVSAKKSSLTIQCDEMWSFVGHKGEQAVILTGLGLPWVPENLAFGGFWHQRQSPWRQCLCTFSASSQISSSWVCNTL